MIPVCYGLVSEIKALIDYLRHNGHFSGELELAGFIEANDDGSGGGGGQLELQNV